MAMVQRCPGCNERRVNDCPICNGNGIIQRRGYSWRDMNEPEKVACHSCQGSGKIICKLCGGVGKIMIDTPQR